jgi:hypothetical protein
MKKTFKEELGDLIEEQEQVQQASKKKRTRTRALDS